MQARRKGKRAEVDRAEILRTLPPRARLAAITATLSHASPSERASLEDELIELVREQRGDQPLPGRLLDLARTLSGSGAPSPDAFVTAARCWRALSRPARDKLLALDRPRWQQTLQAIALDRTPGLRANAARIIADAHAYDHSPMLLDLIADSDAGVADVADQSLLRLAADLARIDLAGLAHAPARRIDPTSRWLFERVVADAIRNSPTHRRRGVILAGIILLDHASTARARALGHGASPLHAALAEGTESSQMMIRSVVRRSREPIVRARALSWLASGPAPAAALDRLGVAHDLADHEAVLRRSHLLARPARARRAAMLEVKVRPDPVEGAGEPKSIAWPAGSPVPSPDVVSQLTGEARAGLPRFCAVVRMGARERGLVLGELIADPDPCTRHAVARAAPRRVVADLCFDPDHRVAAASALQWSMVGTLDAAARPEDLRLVRNLARSPHERVRRLGMEEAERVDVWNPRSPASRLAARRLLASDRGDFIAQLRRRMLEGAAQSRVDAIMVARILGVGAAIEVELLRIAAGDVPGVDADVDRWRVIATSVGALDHLATPAAADALLACLAHAEDRVRANAVEGAARIARRDAGAEGRDIRSRLFELKDDTGHRVRANALRELLRTDREPTAAQGVADMLADTRPMHRVAGLWLTERLLPGGRHASLTRRWTELSIRVAELASVDGDDRVRHRAGRCARRLLSQMRSGWRQRAPALAEAAQVKGAA